MSPKEKLKVKVYGLSTCGFCRRAKQLLTELKVEYETFDIDLMEGGRKKQMLLEVKKLNPDLSFPTIIINSRTIVGFDEIKIREALKL